MEKEPKEKKKRISRVSYEVSKRFKDKTYKLVQLAFRYDRHQTAISVLETKENKSDYIAKLIEEDYKKNTTK